MTAIVLFFLAGVLFSFDGLLVLFVVTPYRQMNVWVCAACMSGAVISVAFTLMLVLGSS